MKRNAQITDFTGMTGCMELAYDALGNVTEEIRTIVLPQHGEEFRLGMLYQYDSWGRMLSMNYPDGEEITYSYQWGGDLYAMHGDKNGDARTYIKGISYNMYGQKEHIDYGNTTSAHYTYDALHRLVNLKSRDYSGALMQDIDYTFDNASNVTKIANNAGVVNTFGGTYNNYYTYDALHRIVRSSGAGIGGIYAMDMEYTSSGRINKKSRYRQSATVSGSANMFYGYCNEYQPHAVRRLFDEDNQKLCDFRWDAAGNLGQVSVANQDALFESGRFLFWTEDNRMHTAVDEEFYSYYAYDYSGERRIKLTGKNTVLDVNAEMMSSLSSLDKVTLYPSAYMVLDNHGYTKHYYAGTERVAARLGGGGLDALLDFNDTLQVKADSLFEQSLIQVNERALDKNDEKCIWGEGVPIEVLGLWIEEIPDRMQADVEIDCSEFFNTMHETCISPDESNEPDVYFYHSDHLGSASWITDNGGIAIQHLQYLPYGEPFVDQRMSGYNERFTFTGKERDEETGFGYFGARYMDHELMTMWLSVDPMADKYPGISPYAYCAWNPVKLVDPDGLAPRIYVETKGFGHAFVSVTINGNLIVYTYGRYAGGDKHKRFGGSSDPQGKGVLIKLTGEAAKQYINYEVEENHASVYELSDVSDEKVMQYYDNLFSSGTRLNSDDASRYESNPLNYGSSDDARVVDRYFLLGNNCVTTSIKGMKEGGSKLWFKEPTMVNNVMVMRDIISPMDLRVYLAMQSIINKRVNKIESKDAISCAN